MNDANTRLAIQLLILALEAAPSLAPLLQRGVTRADLDGLAAADDAARQKLQDAIDAAPAA